MKIKFRLLTLALFSLCLFQNNLLLGQDNETYPKATLNSDIGLTLDTEQELTGTYEMDIDNMGYSSADADATAAFIGSKSDLITVTADFANKRILIKLKLDDPSTNGWTLSDWNTHLQVVK